MVDIPYSTANQANGSREILRQAPRMQNYPGLKAASIIKAMREVLESTGEKTLHEAFNDTIETVNRRMQECPRAYTVRT